MHIAEHETPPSPPPPTLTATMGRDTERQYYSFSSQSLVSPFTSNTGSEDLNRYLTAQFMLRHSEYAWAFRICSGFQNRLQLSECTLPTKKRAKNSGKKHFYYYLFI
jgi:hypothetical protein